MRAAHRPFAAESGLQVSPARALTATYAVATSRATTVLVATTLSPRLADGNAAAGSVVLSHSVATVAATSASQPATGRLADRPLSSKSLFVGMTDTQVLNLPSCGRPARITRTREMNAWREQWTYQDRNSGKDRRVLYFENGRLVTQEYIAPSALREVQASASD
jgi:hypothetical protein